MYKYVIPYQESFGLSYYGVSGTNWDDPPILKNPSEYRTIDGREYMLFYEQDRLRLVGWQTSKGSYWVINTLTHALSEDAMLGLATSTRELGRIAFRPMEAEREAGRRRRRRLGRPGDGDLLRRAGAPDRRPRRERREGRVAPPRRGDDPRARPRRAPAKERRAHHLHDLDGRRARLRAPPLLLRRHAADLLGRRGPLARALGRRRSFPRTRSTRSS